MFLNCPDEVLRYIGRTFQSALADPIVASRLAENPVSVRVGFIDPDCVLVVDIARGEVRFASAAEEPTAALVAMNVDTAVRYCQGRLNVSEAVASGDIVAVGEAKGILDLLTETATLPRLYAAVVRREGREDLLVA